MGINQYPVRFVRSNRRDLTKFTNLKLPLTVGARANDTDGERTSTYADFVRIVRKVIDEFSGRGGWAV
jgi:hypothetical protein